MAMSDEIGRRLLRTKWETNGVRVNCAAPPLSWRRCPQEDHAIDFIAIDKEKRSLSYRLRKAALCPPYLKMFVSRLKRRGRLEDAYLVSHECIGSHIEGYACGKSSSETCVQSGIWLNRCCWTIDPCLGMCEVECVRWLVYCGTF